MTSTIRLITRCVGLCLSLLLLPAGLAEADTPVSFARQVRPVLSEYCFHCHGPDSVSRQADLRLDQPQNVLGDDQHHAVVVPGHPEQSELLARMTSRDPDSMMPPVDSGKQPTPEEIQLIQRWIEQGADWEEHWSLIAPQRPTPPTVEGDDWSQGDIDRFVLQRLRQEGLKPSPPADPRTWIRRVTLDLTGLPPTPEEVEAFLADSSEHARQTVVDRLLQSPRYGEKMALPWLEAARYADTSGYTEDYGRFMYPWRTWVINAFNNHMPYDDFVTDQLAGDLRENATREQILATGFNRNHRINQEVGALNEEFIVEYAVDRLETFGTVFLGMTVGCARCHDHKYDSLSQKEFYQLYAFFNNNADIGVDHQSRFGFCKPFLEWPTKQQTAERERVQNQLETLKQQPADSVAETEDYEQWLAKFDHGRSIGLGTWHSLGPFEHEEPTRVTGFQKPFFAEPEVDLQQQVQEQTWTAQPTWKPGTVMVPGGEFSTIYVYRDIYVPETGEYGFDIGASDAVRIWLNGKVILDRVEEGDNVATPAPFLLPLKAGRNELLVKMSNGDFVQQITFRTTSHVPFPHDVFDRLSTLNTVRGTVSEQRLQKYFHQTQVDAVQEQLDKVNRSIAKVMVMKERKKPRPAHVLERGYYATPTEEVQRDVPAVFPELPTDAPKNRLGLAGWLTSENHPLTARVAVNRLWQNHFGRGIVRTEEDFGAQGEYPTHPDLLDWLATELIRSDWDLQHLQRLIVLSATYGQSSAGTGQQARQDPDNRLLSRGPRFRLRPQEIRDQALFASGLLVEELGGPSVFPYQPPGLWREITSLKLQSQWFLTVDYEQSHGPDLYRRSLYTFWKRSVPPPNMTVFDAETREVCVVKRQNSNTPLQAMNLLNDVTYVEAARHLAHRMLTEGGPSVSQQLDHGLQLLLSRSATNTEQAILQSGLEQQLEYYRQHPQHAEQLLSAGDSGVPGDHEVATLAGWTQVALLLLNLDEAITRN